MAPTRFAAEIFYLPSDDSLRFLPECPLVLQNFPDRSRRVLGWIAIQHSATSTEGSINLLDLATRTNETHPLPGRPGFFVETSVPGLVLIGLERRLVLYDLTDRTMVDTNLSVPDDDRVIINDGLAVDGGVLFGTKHLDFNQPRAALYFFDARQRSITEIVGGQICSNGKMLTRDNDGATLIDIDSSPKKISRYRLDKSLKQVLDSSLVVQPEELPALPDGLRPTPEGDVVVAFYNPDPVENGLAWQMSPGTGKVVSEWLIPGSPRVTCPELVEMDGRIRVLFATAVEGMPKDVRSRADGAGALYIADSPFTGTVPRPPLLELQAAE